MTALGERSGRVADIDVDSLINSNDELAKLGTSASSPELELMRRDERSRVNSALRYLPVGYREVLILREMEELAYDQIASITGVPVGTVMSRLSRARQSFKQAFLISSEGESV
jgi:RNA polymerase sigma factor (sigma-70 family)